MAVKDSRAKPARRTRNAAGKRGLTLRREQSARPVVDMPSDQAVQADWRDVVGLSRFSIQNLQVNSVFGFRITACLVNGIACGTAFYTAAAWKLEWLKDVRSIVENDSTMSDSDKQAKLQELDREKDDILGKDLKKSWNTVKANLERRLRAAKALLHDSTTEDGLKTWRAEVDRLQSMLDGLQKEGPPK